MKLSDSILLGEIYYGKDDGDIALRAWRAAVGPMDALRVLPASYMEAQWPWLEDINEDVVGNVELKYRAMLAGDLTLDDIWHYVHSIEPDCGECNEFHCVCQVESKWVAGIIRKSANND